MKTDIKEGAHDMFDAFGIDYKRGQQLLELISKLIYHHQTDPNVKHHDQSTMLKYVVENIHFKDEREVTLTVFATGIVIGSLPPTIEALKARLEGQPNAD